MAISATSLTSGTDNATTDTFATASISPTTGRMVYLGVGTIQVSGNEAAAAVPSSVSGAGLTWTLVHDEVSTLTGAHESVYRAYASSPSPGAVTIAFAGTKALCAWSIVEVDGANTGGTNGANSVVQADGAQNDTGSATNAPVTLASFADAGNGALAFAFHVGVGSTPTATPDTGWTELNESTNFDAVGYGIQASWRADNDTTVATSWSVGGYSRGIALEIAAAAATLTQARGRFREDDGSETTASWAAAENANVSAAVGDAIRLRTQVQATGDPASATYTLRAQKNGAGGYVLVPVGASVTPTLSYGAAGAFAYSATNPAAAYPTGITADSELVLIVGQKPSSANGGTVTTPSGWTLQASLTGANDGNTGGYSTTLAADTGNCNIYVYTKDSVSGSESGSLTVTTGTNNVAWAQIIRLQKSIPGTVSWAAATGKDTAGGSVSIATGALDLAAGDYLIGGMVIPTDVTTPSQFSAHALSQSGTTFGTVTEIGEADTTTNNDLGGYLIQAPVSSGSGSGAVTMTATAGGTTTNVRGPGFVLRARPVSVANELYIATSSNITDGGATTQQLTAGSGTFQAGQIVDASNAITLNLGSGYHTEFEHCLATQAPATNGDYWDLRIYRDGSPLDTYTNTLRLTMAAASGSYDVSLSETGSAADSFGGVADFVRAVTEAASAADAVSGFGIFPRSLSETGSAADTLAGGLGFAVAIAETATAIDSLSAAYVLVGALAESATATDTTSASAVFPRSVSESGAAADTVSGVGVFPRSLTEAVTAADAVSGARVTSPSLSESASAADVVSALATLIAALSESVNATEIVTADTTGTISVSITETATATDALQSALQAVASLAETATAADVLAALRVTAAALSEAGSALDALTASAVYTVTITEAGAAAETTSATGAFGAGLLEMLSAADVVAVLAEIGIGSDSRTVRVDGQNRVIATRADGRVITVEIGRRTIH